MGADTMATTKKAAKKATKKATKKRTTGAAHSREVVVRMYNVGFGDAFLVLLPDGKEQRRILFDCGSIQSAPGIEMNDLVDRIVADVTDPDGVPRIDVVVGTHRHKDHVSGFGAAPWADVHVKEVWMPWTEDPSDSDARSIRDVQSKLAVGLDAVLTARAKTLGAAEREALGRYHDIVGNALTLTNDKEMRTLHSGFQGGAKRRFLPTKTDEGKKSRDARTFTTAALPGVTVHVLGPSRSRDLIRDMDPPKGESFLRLRGALDTRSGRPPAPFPGEAPYKNRGGGLTADDLREIQSAGSASELAVAVALDKAVNGTSLMLILEVAGTYLLFPGDAQWGTWNAAMEDPEWREMLERVSFYKVGHHGSHNATPRSFVAAVAADGLCCMASTLTRKIWPEIPRGPLLSALAAKKANIARSDQINKVGKPFLVDDGVIEVRLAL